MTTPLFEAPPAAPLVGSEHFRLRRNTPGNIAAHGLKGHTPCEECIWVIHEAKGKGPAPNGATRKWTSPGIQSVLLCNAHAAMWKTKPKGRPATDRR
ncbi:hypothetical protein ACFQZ4_24045 [Catellatospora coxensis]|uniref:Uncharacterized protein n=1 Tax=Catellatospora coxensis TaxID=310354 RepID=A0A8J3PB19_9ACTN|nr:hypothetical protein [Catellatospora coxensis]GIG10189.1 hypothetical protein Cco03nite_68890 [Catellatospora coxensis]